MKSADEIHSIQQELRAKGVKYCIGAYVDIHGIPKGKFVPIDSFQLNVPAPEGGPTTAFLGVSIGDHSLTWSGTLEDGNFTLHKD